MQEVVKLIDSYTGEVTSYYPITEFEGGGAVTDADVDGVIIRKKGDTYYKRAFTGPVNVKWFGAKGDGVTDDTTAINTAITTISNLGGGVVDFNSLTYKISPGTTISSLTPDGGVILKSDVVLQSGSFIIDAQDSEAYAVIHIIQASNSKVTNFKILGDRETHTGTGGEHGHGVNILDSSGITVENSSISNCWGDGIYVGSISVACEDITINLVDSKNNRRQGLSITSVDKMIVSNSNFSLTNGTDPEAGIDVEPNSGQSVTNLSITGCTFKTNDGAGIEVSATKSGATINGVTISGNVFDDNAFSVRCRRSLVQNISITGNSFKNARYLEVNIAESCKDVSLLNNIFGGTPSVIALRIDAGENIIISGNTFRGVNNRNIMVNSFTNSDATVSHSSGISIINNNILALSSQVGINIADTSPESITISGNIIKGLGGGTYAIGLQGTNLSVINNTIDNFAYGVQFIGPATSANIQNNSFYNTTSSGIGESSTYSIDKLQILSNLFVSNRRAVLFPGTDIWTNVLLLNNTLSYNTDNFINIDVITDIQNINNTVQPE